MLKLLVSLIAGAVSVLAFAPFGWWPLMIPSLGCLFVLLYNTTEHKACAAIGYSYGLGLFGAGVYWIYYSLHLFGAAIAPLAALGTFLFVAALALYPTLFAFLASRFRRTPCAWFILVTPALWVLIEWFRSWFLTGFPWLSIGYSTIHTPLAGFAPVGGVYLNSLMLAMICGAAALMFADRSRRSILVATSVIVGIAATGQALKQISWTEAVGDPVSVTMVQGNIAQELKFQPNLIEDSLRTYAELSNTGSELVIWPESAIPTFFSDVALWEEEFATKMAERGSTVMSGGFHANADFTEYFNAIKVLGSTNDQVYAKRHLVPFGEFIPFRSWLTLLADLIEIPMSDLSPGRGPSKPLSVNGIAYGVSICYEGAFGREMLGQFSHANVLVNISNDAWFGDSTAPHQHQEIAAMRALEFQRPMVRATNTGVSAAISRSGLVVSSAPQFERHALQVQVEPRSGRTPYSKFGDWLVLILVILFLLLGAGAKQPVSQDLP